MAIQYVMIPIHLFPAGLYLFKLKAPNTADEKFEDVVKSAQDAAVLVLVY